MSVHMLLLRGFINFVFFVLSVLHAVPNYYIFIFRLILELKNQYRRKEAIKNKKSEPLLHIEPYRLHLHVGFS
jgi:hypothetical protein